MKKPLTQVRVRAKVNRKVLPDGKLTPWSPADIRGARERNVRAESYLTNLSRLPSLRANPEDLSVVREYLEQHLHADYAQTDPSKWRSLMAGVTEFCLLGLHRDAEPAVRAGKR